MRSVMVLFSVLVLSACAPGLVLNDDSDGIVIRSGPSNFSADAEAQRRCEAYGRVAEKIGTAPAPGTFTHTYYDCAAPS